MGPCESCHFLSLKFVCLVSFIWLPDSSEPPSSLQEGVSELGEENREGTPGTPENTLSPGRSLVLVSLGKIRYGEHWVRSHPSQNCFMEAAGKSLSLLGLSLPPTSEMERVMLTTQGWGEEWDDSQEGVLVAAKAVNIG